MIENEPETEDRPVHDTPPTTLKNPSNKSTIDDVYNFIGTPSPLIQKSEAKFMKTRQVITDVITAGCSSKIDGYKTNKSSKSDTQKNTKEKTTRQRAKKIKMSEKNEDRDNTGSIQTTMTKFFDTPDHPSTRTRRSLRRSVSEQADTLKHISSVVNSVTQHTGNSCSLVEEPITENTVSYKLVWL